jgi:hypothetical protein
MDRRRFLRGSLAAALALPALGSGMAGVARAEGGGGQTAVVVSLISQDPEVGVGGWVDTADGGRYDLTGGVVAIPGTAGQSLGATVYRDDGCTQEVTLQFQAETTLLEVGGC